MRNPNKAEINHLRRLLAWCECEVGQEPEQYLETIKKIAPICINEDNKEHARNIFTDDYNKLKAKPIYVRAAIKSLKKYLKEIETGSVVDGDFEVELAADIELIGND